MSFKIDKIAKLARIRLENQEKQKLAKDMESILAYVHQLEKLPTDDVEPTSHVLDMENVYRPDKVEPCDIRDNILNHAPEREENFFKVPKVVDKE